MTKNDIPQDTNSIAGTYLNRQRPSTMMEALMLSIDDNIEESLQELQPLREAVATCIEQLNEQDQFIVNAINSEFLSYEQLGKRLGVSKPHAWRLKNNAYAKLQQLLTMHPLVRKKVRVANTWEQSASQWVMHIASFATEERRANIEMLFRLIDSAKCCLFDNDDLPVSLLWTEIGIEAIEELRRMDEWDSGEMCALLVSKQHDYGHGNITAFGLRGVLVRLSDKIERLNNLQSKKTKARNESLVDTLRDIVGYCVIALMLNDETFGLELGENVANESVSDWI
ncbi:MAG: DUF1599 domain-containing protein [Planctomycetes bacterium]|nr:DUF1599 domain-containing protein [Planctomycetota bacterium]